MVERTIAQILRALRVASASDIEIGHQPVAKLAQEKADWPHYYAKSSSVELDISFHEYVELEHAGALED